MWGYMDLHSVSGDLLFSSSQPTLKRALIEAVGAGAPLHGIDLRCARLCGAPLDGMTASGACLWGADLTGCDLAEADLSGADMRLARLTDTCLADSLCAGALFDGAYFKDTLITGADFSGCCFSCPSVFSLPLHVSAGLTGAVYWHRGEQACPLDGGVTRIQIAAQDIIVLGTHVLIDGMLHGTTESGVVL